MKGIIGIICPILQVFKVVLFNTVHTIYGLLKARIPAELFQILKDDAVKVLHSICQQIWKTQQWPHHSSPKERQCQRMLKLLHSCTHPDACKVMLKILPDVQLDLEKVEEPEVKLPTSAGSSKKQESSRKTSTSALLTTQKPLTVWITTNYGKFFSRWEYQTT